MCLDLFSEETPVWFHSCKRPLLVRDPSVFAFWVVAYGRFNCILFWFYLSTVSSFLTPLKDLHIIKMDILSAFLPF